MKKRWTDSDIQMMRRLFEQGVLLKVIADYFNSTTTAINKVLQRYGCRNTKRRTAGHAPTPPTRRYQKDPKTRGIDSQWTTLDHLLNALESTGHSVLLIPGDASHEPLYRVDGTLFHPMGLVLWINRTRCDKGLPPLFVENVTWS